MAVQAQYPKPREIGMGMAANVLSGSAEICNTRKRGRETLQHPINFSLQTHQKQHQQQQAIPPLPSVMNHYQLHTTQPSLISTGLGLSLEGQHHHQHHQNHQKPQPIASSSPQFSSFLTEELAAQIKHQKDEIDQLFRAQGDQLRRTLAESRQRHYRVLLGLAEQSAAQRLREKEVEVEKAALRNAELEKRVVWLKTETMKWQAKAQAGKAAAETLQAQLQLVAASEQQQGGVEEPGCAAEPAAAAAEDAESAYVDPERRRAAAAGMCRACGGRVVSVVLLPCRHLCVCRECNAAVEACPVCLCVRRASVEVYLS